MVTRTAQTVAGREATSRRNSADSCTALTDERASRVGNIEHRPSTRCSYILGRIRLRQGRSAAALAHRDKLHHKAMNLVRHLEHMIVSAPALARVAVEP